MTYFAAKNGVNPAGLDDQSIQEVQEKVDRVGRFPVQGGDFLPTNRRGWFDAVAMDGHHEKMKTSKVAR